MKVPYILGLLTEHDLEWLSPIMEVNILETLAEQTSGHLFSTFHHISFTNFNSIQRIPLVVLTSLKSK